MKIFSIRIIIFPILIVFIATLNSIIKNYWITGLIAWACLMLFFIFYYPDFRISLSMTHAIKRKAFEKAIHIGEKAVTTGKASNAIKINLLIAYFNNNDIQNAQRLLAIIEDSEISNTEKEILETWKQRISESINQNN